MRRDARRQAKNVRHARVTFDKQAASKVLSDVDINVHATIFF